MTKITHEVDKQTQTLREEGAANRVAITEDIGKLCTTIIDCTDATAKNLGYLQVAIKQSAEKIELALDRSSKSSTKLADRAHQLTITTIVIAIFGLLIAAGHLVVNYMALP